MSGHCKLGSFGWIHTIAESWCQCKVDTIKSENESLKKENKELQKKVDDVVAEFHLLTQKDQPLHETLSDCDKAKKENAELREKLKAENEFHKRNLERQEGLEQEIERLEGKLKRALEVIDIVVKNNEKSEDVRCVICGAPYIFTNTHAPGCRLQKIRRSEEGR